MALWRRMVSVRPDGQCVVDIGPDASTGGRPRLLLSNRLIETRSELKDFLVRSRDSQAKRENASHANLAQSALLGPQKKALWVNLIPIPILISAVPRSKQIA